MNQPSLPIRHTQSPVAWQPDTPPDLSQDHTVFLDAETDGLQWFKGARPVGWAVTYGDGSRYLPFGHRGGGNLDEATVRRWAERELRGKHIVNLNTRFDAHMARAWGVDLEAQGCTFEDVAHSAALLDDHRRQFSLEALAQAELGIGKLDAGPKGEIVDLPAWDVAAYATRDTELVRDLRAAYAPRLAAEDLGRVQALENAVIPVVVEMEQNGMPLDLPTLEQWERWSARLLDDLRWQVTRATGFDVNPDSPTDMVRVFESCGLEIRRTVKGAPSFTKDVIRAVNHPTVNLIYQVGKLVDLRNKYLVKYLRDQHNGILYPTLYQLMVDEGGTVSGRFSCAKPNLQQVMGADKHGKEYGFLTPLLAALTGEAREHAFLIKELFVPAEGQWLAADAKQIEFRLFAHYSGSARLIDAYRRDPLMNFHKMVGGMIQEVAPNVTHTETKVFNFTGVYGGGVGAAAGVLGVGVDEAQPVYDEYHRAYPEARQLLYKAKGVAETRGFVRSILGRRSRFPNKERTHKALNAVVQPSAADINKLVMVEAYKQRKLLELTLRMTVHDELDADARNPSKLPLIEEVLNTQYVPTSVPILWEVGMGKNWAAAK
jgi:DNA polymerase-1